MVLKFPIVRLHIKNLIAKDGLSGAAAIAKAAADFDLIDGDSADQIASVLKGDECRCLAATKAVLAKYFAQRNNRDGMQDHDLEAIWQSIETEIECRQKEPKQLSYQTGDRLDQCLKDAPVMFDLLLQQIRRYP